MTDGPRMLFDKGTGRPILISPGRLKRPRNTGADQDGASDCPFCAGSEAQTPKEVAAVRLDGTAPDTPGWTVRAFPNLYPAAPSHEVIAEGCAHTTQPTELSLEVLGDSLTLYRERIAALEARADVACAFLFKNVGAAAGASIAHNHSQLLGLPVRPPRLDAELRASRDRCLHCEEIETAAAEDRIIHRGSHHVLLSPSTPKLPYEAWMLPIDHGDDFLLPAHGDDLARTLAVFFTGAENGFRDGAFNLCLHRIAEAEFHWHFELHPRVGTVAALEIGGDMYINAITPQRSSARWRDAIA
jgi:UDPglucose--hexose-1-phosphate uridylyltransferase